MKLAILTGVIHSGTTLLLEMLKSHPDIYADYEIGLLYAEDLSAKSFREWYSKHYLFFQFLNRSYNFCEKDIEFLGTSKNWPAVYHNLFNLIKAKDLHARSRNILIDKTPEYSLILDSITERLPGVPIIGIVRDPRSVYNSWLKRNRRQKTSPQNFCEIYRKSITQLLLHASVIIQLEKLIIKPDIVKSICEILEINYVPQMSNPQNSFRKNMQIEYNNDGQKRITENGLETKNYCQLIDRSTSKYIKNNLKEFTWVFDDEH
jgi:hypothetical protein